MRSLHTLDRTSLSEICRVRSEYRSHLQYVLQLPRFHALTANVPDSASRRVQCHDCRLGEAPVDADRTWTLSPCIRQELLLSFIRTTKAVSKAAFCSCDTLNPDSSNSVQVGMFLVYTVLLFAFVTASTFDDVEACCPYHGLSPSLTLSLSLCLSLSLSLTLTLNPLSLPRSLSLSLVLAS